MRTIFAALLLFFAAFALPAQAAKELPPSVARAEEYLRGLTTATARFLKTSTDGSQAIGTFYLSRPGKLRFEYDDPIRDYIVADGFFIYFYDSELGEQSNAPIGQTLADFLLRDNLRLSGDIKIAEVQRSGGLLQITLVQEDDPAAGSITLGFNEEPMVLKKWRVMDSTGQVTEIELFQLATGVPLDSSLFVYRAPDGSKPAYNE